MFFFSIIVSQWTSLLNILEIHVKKRNLAFTRIDGKVKPVDRQERVDSFNKTNRGPVVMLLSLQAGGVGLNLIGANHLFLMDLHWWVSILCRVGVYIVSK